MSRGSVRFAKRWRSERVASAGTLLGMNALQKIRQLVDDIASADTFDLKKDEWALVGRLLSRMPADQSEVQKVCKDQNVTGLDDIVRRLENPEEPKPSETMIRAKEAAAAVTADEMRHAITAFKKRLKLTRLDDESRIGGRQLTGGRASEIDAIIPPQDIPQHVWDALVEAGRMKHVGDGFYSLASS